MIQSYLNDPSLKNKTIEAMKADIMAERLVHGTYWNEEKENGCFVGCVIRGNQHSKFETKLGIPRILACLGDRIFEGLPYKESKQFTIDFLEAMPVGVDLSGVWDKFAHFILVDEEYGVIKFAKKESTKKSIQDVANAYARKIAGEKIDINEWLGLRKNAYACAAYAAATYAPTTYAYADYAAANYTYAAYAAATYASATSATAADAPAADVAAYAAATYAADATDAEAARSRHYVILAAKLISLFRQAGSN